MTAEPNFDEFLAAAKDKPLHPTFQAAEPYLPAPGLAYDLGFGSGISSVWLSDHGFRVIAIDSHPEAIAQLEERLASRPNHQVSFILGDASRTILEPCQVVLAGFYLFFLEQDEFEHTWAEVRAKLQPGGVFVGQLMGPKDDWASKVPSVHPEAEWPRLQEGFEVLHWQTDERDGATINGKSKHWHITHFILRRV